MTLCAESFLKRPLPLLRPCLYTFNFVSGALTLHQCWLLGIECSRLGKEGGGLGKEGLGLGKE